jgi:hypothetical protein
MEIRSGHIERAIRNLWPDRGFILDGDSVSGIAFLDRKGGKPTKSELERVSAEAAAVAAGEAGAVSQAIRELARLDLTMPRSYEEILLKTGITVYGAERDVLERKEALRGIATGKEGPVMANGQPKAAR